MENLKKFKRRMEGVVSTKNENTVVVSTTRKLNTPNILNLLKRLRNTMPMMQVP